MSTEEKALCPNCSKEIAMSQAFCGHCGREVSTQESAAREDVFSVLSPTLLYYFTTLILLALFKLTDIFPAGFAGMCIISIMDVAIATGFWINYSGEMKGLFSIRTIRPAIVLAIVALAFVGSIIVSVMADWIHFAITDDVFYEYNFEDTPYPFLAGILFICIQPAIFEEVAFRGFMFSNILKVTNAPTTIYVTSFLFGILHFSVISLVWLVPLGIAFAFLRIRYQTIWYGIIGHFAYNFGIVIIDFFAVV